MRGNVGYFEWDVDFCDEWWWGDRQVILVWITWGCGRHWGSLADWPEIPNLSNRNLLNFDRTEFHETGYGQSEIGDKPNEPIQCLSAWKPDNVQMPSARLVVPARAGAHNWQAGRWGITLSGWYSHRSDGTGDVYLSWFNVGWGTTCHDNNTSFNIRLYRNVNKGRVSEMET